MRLAAIVAARIERAAQRADGAAVGGAVGRVLVLEFVLADRAAAQAAGRPRLGLAREIVAPARGDRDRRRAHEGHAQRDEGRHGARQLAERAAVREHRHHGGDRHRAHPDRVDVVQVGALELDVARAVAERLVDHQVREQRAHPGDRHVGVHRQHLADRLEHAHLHQQQRDQHVEHQPHHAPRMAVREPREEVRPGQRPRVGIGHVDLQLGDDHEQHGHGHRPGREPQRVEQQVVGEQVHLGGLRGLGGVDLVLDRDEGEEGAAQHLQRARHDPAGPGAEQGDPPAPPVARGERRQEAQVVDLLADLHDQREHHGGGLAEGDRAERAALGREAGEGGPFAQQPGVVPEHRAVGQHEQHQPQRLGPALQPVDQRDAEHHDRDHHQRADHVGQADRDREHQLQRERHDGRFQREEDEGEARVEQRGDGRADVAEAGTAREQVHVDAVACRVVADRQAGQPDQQRHRRDRADRVGEAVVDHQAAADRLQHQERDRADRGVRDPEFRPAAKRAGRVAQRVVLQRLVADPGVVVAAHLDDALRDRPEIGPRGLGGDGLVHRSHVG